MKLTFYACLLSLNLFDRTPPYICDAFAMTQDSELLRFSISEIAISLKKY